MVLHAIFPKEVWPMRKSSNTFATVFRAFRGWICSCIHRDSDGNTTTTLPPPSLPSTTTAATMVQAVFAMERKCLLPLLVVSIVVFFATSLRFGDSYLHFFTGQEDQSSSARVAAADPVGSMSLVQLPPSALPPPPKIAYLISGTKADGARMKRVLQALYHPRNQYLLHLDLEAPPRERVQLARYVLMEPTFAEAKNVHVIGEPDLVTYRGPTMIASTLHAIAILLRNNDEWDWFINLSASDYPLITQDDLLHVFSYLPKDLNFIDHTSDIGWKENQRARPMIIDPALYSNRKEEVIWVTQKRKLPTAFKLFTGSAWMALSRAFTTWVIMGWDNLPRTALMYYTNFISSPEGYFHTVICNSKEFRNTTVNHDLHYIAWDNPPKQHPLVLTSKFLRNMTESGAPFARKFAREDPVLDTIDRTLLNRQPGRFVPGGWCVGSSDSGEDPCAKVGDYSVLRPGPGAKRFENLLLEVMSPKTFRSSQCKIAGSKLH